MKRIVVLLLLSSVALAQDAKPLRLVIAGLVHGHVTGFLNGAQHRKDVQIVGLFDPDQTLVTKYRTRYGLGNEVEFLDLAKMLDTVKPDAVATFTSTFDHLRVVEACAQRHIPVMMEKPLAVSAEQAHAIEKAASRGGIPVIVNYETTWYRNHHEIWRVFKEQKSAGEIHRMVAMDGHQGPKEINVQPEFFKWLTDPVQNGAGAMFDFGCYGANLMTWLMDNQRPLKVTALAQTEKPQIYPRVDDQTTIIIEYPKAQGVIQASWNWPFNRKDFEVYGDTGYAVATTGGKNLTLRLNNAKEDETHASPELAAGEQDSISYLASVVRGKKPSGLNSLENNVVVVEILDAARQSVKTGRTVQLGK